MKNKYFLLALTITLTFTATAFATIDLTEIGELNLPGGLRKIAVTENYLYVTESDGPLVENAHGVLSVVDVSDPTLPQEVFSLDFAGFPYDLEIAGNYLYMAAGTEGFNVYDISNPVSPTLAANLPLGERVKVIAISGSYAFVTNENNGFKVIDINNPSEPQLVAGIDSSALGFSYDLAISENHAYLSRSKNLFIIDISNPLSPLQVGQIAFTGELFGLDVSESYLYVNEWTRNVSNQFLVYDVSNPTFPHQVGSTTLSADKSSDIAVLGGVAYMAHGASGLEIIDVNDPTAPVRVGAVRPPDAQGHIGTFAISDGYIYCTAIVNFYAIAPDILIYPALLSELTLSASIPLNQELNLPFGELAKGNYAEKTVTISNDGNYDLHVGDIGKTNSLAEPFSFSFDGCSGQTIQPSAACTLTLRFSATEIGEFSGSLDIPSNDLDEPSVILSVTGAGSAIPVPDIQVTNSSGSTDPYQLTYGEISEGGYSEQIITVTNSGNSDLVTGLVGGIDSLEPPFFLSADNCSEQSIPPASNCAIAISFAPQDEGSFADTFDIPSDDPDEPAITISINGQGSPIPVPEIRVTDSVTPNTDHLLAFGELTEGNSSEQSIIITNNGNADLLLSPLSSTNPMDEPFAIIAETCSDQTLFPSSGCTITISFTPQGGGTFSDAFDISSNDPDKPSIIFTVSGTGLLASANNPPAIPKLLFPANGQSGLDTLLSLKWEKTRDPDGDTVTYKLLLSENPDFKNSILIELAGLAGTEAAIASFGFAAAILLTPLGLRKSKLSSVTFLTLLALALMLSACGGGNSSTSSPEQSVSSSVSGLTPNTTYYWKVIADDGKVGGLIESEIRVFHTQ